MAYDYSGPYTRRRPGGLAIATLGTPQDITAQELRVESFFPMNDDTARTLRSWAAKQKSHGA